MGFEDMLGVMVLGCFQQRTIIYLDMAAMPGESVIGTSLPQVWSLHSSGVWGLQEGTGESFGDRDLRHIRAVMDLARISTSGRLDGG